MPALAHNILFCQPPIYYQLAIHTTHDQLDVRSSLAPSRRPHTFMSHPHHTLCTHAGTPRWCLCCNLCAYNLLSDGIPTSNQPEPPHSLINPLCPSPSPKPNAPCSHPLTSNYVPLGGHHQASTDQPSLFNQLFQCQPLPLCRHAPTPLILLFPRPQRGLLSNQPSSSSPPRSPASACLWRCAHSATANSTPDAR